MIRKTKKIFSSEEIATIRYHMVKNNIHLYNKKSIMRTVVGSVMIGVGLVTFLVPFTTIPLCIGGGVLVGYDVKALISRVRLEGKLYKLRCFKWLGVWR